MENKTDYIFVYNAKDMMKILLDSDNFELDDKNKKIKVIANQMRKNAYDSMAKLISEINNDILDKNLIGLFKEFYKVKERIKTHDERLFSEFFRDYDIKYEDNVKLLFDNYDKIAKLNNIKLEEKELKHGNK